MDRFSQTQKPPEGFQKEAFDVKFLSPGDKIEVITFNHSAYYLMVDHIDERGRPFMVPYIEERKVNLSGYIVGDKIARMKTLTLEDANGRVTTTSNVMHLRVFYETAASQTSESVAADVSQPTQETNDAMQVLLNLDPEQLEVMESLIQLSGVVSAGFPGSSMTPLYAEACVAITTDQGIIHLVGVGGSLEVGIKGINPKDKEPELAEKLRPLMEKGGFRLGGYKYKGNYGEHYRLSKG